jgi:cytochrome c oxidase assembly factor CtaG
MTLGQQVAVLFILAIPIACIAWTVTHEEVLREPREWCLARSKTSRRWAVRKIFYVVTCEYCFSHYVTIAALVATHFTLLFDGWRGYVIAGFSLVWIANLYMSFFARLRLEIREERLEVAVAESKMPKR